MQDNKQRIIKYLDALDKPDNIFLNSSGWDSDGHFYGLFQGIADILREMKSMQRKNEHLNSQLEKITAEKWKDEELARMKERLENVLMDARRGFPITEEQEKAISAWKLQHLKEKHPKALKDPTHFGAIGGNFNKEVSRNPPPL